MDYKVKILQNKIGEKIDNLVADDRE